MGNNFIRIHLERTWKQRQIIRKNHQHWDIETSQKK